MKIKRLSALTMGLLMIMTALIGAFPIEYLTAHAADTDLAYAFYRNELLRLMDDGDIVEDGASDNAEGSRFDLYDFDRDGIPELVYSHGHDMQSLKEPFVRVYTFSDSELLEYEFNTHTSSVSVNSEKGLLFTSEPTGTGAGEYRCYYRYLDGSFTNECTLQWRSSFTGNFSYNINNQSVSEEQYKAEIEKYDALNWETIGRKYTFDAETINSLFKDNSWVSLYEAKLREYDEKRDKPVVVHDGDKTWKCNEKYEYTLIYLDDDDVPELIISPIYFPAPHYAFADLFAISNGSVLENGLGGDHCTFAYKEYENIIHTYHHVNMTDIDVVKNKFLKDGLLLEYPHEFDTTDFISNSDLTYYPINEENIHKLTLFAKKRVKKENEILHGSFYYAGTKEVSGSEDDTLSDYYYSDSYFYNDSREYNPSLATMSLCLELSAWSSHESDEWYDPSLSKDSLEFYEDKLQNLKSLLLGNPHISISNPAPNGFQGIGFSDFKANKYWEAAPTVESIGVCAAKKCIHVPKENQDYTLIALVIRGGGYEAEWASNFIVGKEGDHAGFAKARDDVLEFFDSYYDGLTSKEKNNVKIWITGYSRGAITANMVAGFMDYNIVLEGKYSNLVPANIYCYTFEPPQGEQKSMMEETLLKDKIDYSNIHNHVNVNDIVPMVAFSNWGFTRNGTDLWYPSPCFDKDFTKKENEMKKQLREMGFSEFVENKYNISDSISVLNIAKDDSVKSLSKKAALKDIKVERVTISTQEALMKGVSYISYDAIMGIDKAKFMDDTTPREKYYKDYQEIVRDVTLVLSGCKRKNPQSIVDILDVFSFESLKYIAEPMFSINPFYSRAERQDEVYRRLNGRLGAVGLPIATIDKIAILFVNLFGTAYGELAIHNPYYFNTFSNLIAAIRHAGVIQTHYPEISLAWLRSMDPNYNPSNKFNLSDTVYKKLDQILLNKIHVSSDGVKYIIYDNDGNIIAEYQNGKYTFSSPDNGISYTNVDGETCISFPTYQDYIVHFTSEDEKQLNIAIDKYDLLSGQTVDKTVYTDIPVQNGETIVVSTPKLSNDNPVSAEQKCELKVNNVPVQSTEHIIMNEESEKLNVTLTQEGNGGIIAGAGVFDQGDFVTVYAAPLPEAEFSGWYSNDELVSTNTDFSFIVEESIDLTAKFSDIDFYELDFTDAEHGTIETLSDSFPAGYQIALYAQPDEGYEFVEWQASSGTIDNPSENGALITMPDGAVTISAIFRKTEQSTDIIESGECGLQGDNLTWTLDSAGTLTISGTGDMDDYGHATMYPSPWAGLSVHKVEIKDGVTSIGKEAFWWSGMSEIEVPLTVERIGIGAFAFTPWLEKQQQENNVVILNNIIIDVQTNDTSFTVPDGIISIGGGAFYGCSDLTDISFPETIKSIGYSAFDGCTGLTNIQLPNSITLIESYAFYGCTGLTSITIPAGVTCIDYAAFNNCQNLTIKGFSGTAAEKYALQNQIPFESLGEEEHTFIRGDVTQDSFVGIDDAQITLKAYTNRIAGNALGLTVEQIKAADVNGDGEISVDDAQNILIYYVNNTVAGKVLTWDELLGKN